jgi:haloalkane dehalogenase
MMRRDFLAGFLMSSIASAESSDRIDAAWYRRSRKFVDLPMSRVAYVEHGRGPAALFLHGYPLNSYQWRGALERLHMHRRCIAPDVMGLGYTETPASQAISPETQVAMLGAFLDALHVDSVDLVANDSGGLVAQLFVAKYPRRVKSLLLTNCDVDEDNPPKAFLPFVEAAKKGTLFDQFILSHLKDKAVARSAQGMGGQAYTHPEDLTDETIEAYLRPLAASPLRKEQFHQYTISLGKNELVSIRKDLRAWNHPARIVWGMKDTVFSLEGAAWLDRTLPGSRGVRRVEDAKLFFPEEMPDLIAGEAAQLWGVSLESV